MINELQILVEMQKIDDVIGEKISLTKALPKKLNDMIEGVNVANEKVKMIAEELSENKKTQKLKELEIKSNIEQMGKYKNQLLNVQTNKEYKALNSEVSHLENVNSSIDDEILLLMENETKLKEQSQAEQKIQEAAQKELKENEDKLNEEIEVVTAEITELRSKRNSMAKTLPTNIIKRYAALIKNKNRKAVVFNVGNTCGGCGYSLRPQLLIELKKATRIINCENCGRMLVYNELK